MTLPWHMSNFGSSLIVSKILKSKSATNSSQGSDEDLKGHFTNAANVSHVDDHFLIDFFLVISPAGQLLSGIVVTPGHMRRLREAIAPGSLRLARVHPIW